jgi:hypothetical protein
LTLTIAPSPSSSSRVLGLAGILGGAVLLAAFVVEISPDLNTVRLILFHLGAIAIVVAVHRRQVASSPSLARAAAIAAVLANAWNLAWLVLSTGRQNPFAGDFGLVYFYAGLAMWLTDAAFGVVALRLRVVTRWGALALVVGSLLAITGMDRLGLTSRADPTILLPLSLIGIALNGLAWIVLGIDIATRDRRAAARPN